MKPIQLTIIAAVLASGTAFADSARVQNLDNKHYYQRFDKTRGWADANAFCNANGGYLATVTSYIEENFIWDNLGSTNTQTEGIWLGATDEKQEGLWAWVTGEKSIYTNWYSGQPDNGGKYGQHYLFMYTNNYPSSEPISFWGDFSSINSSAGAGDDVAHTVSTLCEWNTLPDVYGQISLLKAGVKGAAVTLKQAGQADKTIATDSKGNYQLKRKKPTLPATVVIQLP
ncbi:MAG: C-type lectin domain-containing protein [Methylovulum sp.]|uniref:C-type lectin domain-containing protein n=1 Tax=Methylovulum sp. TaxID=1916980 RepID=UPI002617ABBC|nr:C-type lectin domain-containing protein [Methylovulum sp.]MDD2723254.1 C-type lectin domain-containing protein [Methylovulum sp.]MDD5123425.1 C-type lectin domain-containing protein [Methylovulum sp.]